MARLNPKNPRKPNFLVSTVVLCLAMVGCSSDNADTDSENVADLVGLDGAWMRSCEASGDGVSSSVDTVIINSDLAERIRENYADSDCQQVSSRTSYDAAITYGESSILADSGFTAQQVDLLVGEIRYTPLTEAVANEWNQGSLCERTDYSINNPTVVPLDCVTDLGAGNLFGLWAIDGDALYFGNNPTDALVAEERPIELNFDSPFSRR